jgi:DNA-binding transcriptional MerR regulator
LVVNEPVAKKVYYSIGDVCELVGLKQHVLRYWETQFDVLKPKKNKGGNRVFRAKDVEIVLLVKHLLYDQKYTIEGARLKLKDMRRSGTIEQERADVLRPAFLRSMKDDLRELRDLLSLPAEA